MIIVMKMQMELIMFISDDTQTDEEQIVTSSENMLFVSQRPRMEFKARVDHCYQQKYGLSI